MSRLAIPSRHKLAAEPLCGIVLVDASSVLILLSHSRAHLGSLRWSFGRLAGSFPAG